MLSVRDAIKFVQMLLILSSEPIVGDCDVFLLLVSISVLVIVLVALRAVRV